MALGFFDLLIAWIAYFSITWVIFSFVVGIVATDRFDRSGGFWTIGSLVFSPLMMGLALFALGPNGPCCPKCRETVRRGATRCRFCCEDLAIEAEAAAPKPPKRMVIGSDGQPRLLPMEPPPT